MNTGTQPPAETPPGLLPEPLPNGAQAFAGAESLINRMKGDKILACSFAPVGLAAVGLLAALFCSIAPDMKTAADVVAFVLLLALAAVPAFGCTYPLLQLYKSADVMQKIAPLYKDRAMALTPDYLEIFTGALEEHERCYYAKRGTLVVRLPWDAIEAFVVGKYKSGKHSYTRGYVISAPSLPDRFSGELRVMSVHFEEIEPALLEALAPRLKAALRNAD